MAEVTVVAALLCWAPSTASGDGFNDWPGALVEADEVDVVAALQGWAWPERGAYGALQLQVGLAETVELSVTAAAGRESGRFAGDGVYVQPRLALSDQLSVTLGCIAPLPQGTRSFSLVAGLTHTLWLAPKRWKLNWNLFATAPTATFVDAPPELYLVAVVERRLSATLGIYVEVDLTRTWRTPQTAVDVFAGAEWTLTPDHVLNAAVQLPLTPGPVDPRGAVAGLWYSYTLEHGVGSAR